MTGARLNWSPIIDRAAQIVEGYDIAVTLRQLFYRLVSEQLVPNTDTSYKRLSALTADLRRSGTFPALYDRGRGIEKPAAWDSQADALQALVDQFRLDRTRGQDVSVWLAVEKNALAGLLSQWFSEYGLPVTPLGGYGSESLDRAVTRAVHRDGRDAVLIIAGDFDASGMDITRNFVAMTGCWAKVQRIGLDAYQVDDLALPVLRGKASDSRAGAFIDRYAQFHDRHDLGRDVEGRRVPAQVELDAVDPNLLHRWYADAIAQFWDTSTYESVLADEASQRDRLRTLAETEMRGDDDATT